MTVGIGIEAAQVPFWEYINRIVGTVYSEMVADLSFLWNPMPIHILWRFYCFWAVFSSVVKMFLADQV
jgi:hypothetical protein